MPPLVALIANVDKSGLLEVKVQLTRDFHSKQVIITIDVIGETPANPDDLSWEERPWTEEELKELMRFEGKTGAEIATSDAIGGWAHMGITDSVAFVEELRRKEAER